MKVSAIVVAVAGVVLYPVASASAQGVNDAQIASIVVTANQVDIDAGKLAASQLDERRGQDVCAADGHRPHRRQQVGDGPRGQAQGHAAGQSNQSEPED